mgnify:FL=1
MQDVRDEMIDPTLMQFPEDDGANPQCATVLLIDDSASMSGDPINEVNKGLAKFRTALQANGLAKRRCQVSLITFGGGPQVVQDFCQAENLPAFPQLHAHGDTPMNDAILTAIERIRSKKSEIRATGAPQYRSWIFLLTDAQPTEDVSEAIRAVHQGAEARSFFFFAVGCNGADMSVLERIAHPSLPAMELKGLKYEEYFRWASDSLTKVSGSIPGQQLALSPTRDFLVLRS